MFDVSNPTKLAAPTEAAQIQLQQQAADARESAATIQALQTPKYSREGFLEEAERLTLLARMGVDIDTLDEVESKIEELEALNERDETQQAELESLIEQREQIFRDAMQRQNGESLPPGSMLSISV